MSLSDLASLGSFVSGVAVLISLIYLALQVRQAERNQRALVQQGRAARLVDFQMHLATPEMAALFVKGAEGGDLSAVELFQFRQMSRAILASFEDTFYQHRERLLADAPFRSARFIVGAGLASSPGRRALWRLEREAYANDFRAYVDRLASAEVASRDGLAEWRAALAAQLAEA
jgi:hypothetical protein